MLCVQLHNMCWKHHMNHRACQKFYQNTISTPHMGGSFKGWAICIQMYPFLGIFLNSFRTAILRIIVLDFLFLLCSVCIVSAAWKLTRGTILCKLHSIQSLKKRIKNNCSEFNYLYYLITRQYLDYFTIL